VIRLLAIFNIRNILFAIVASAVVFTCIITFLPILDKPFNLDEPEEAVMGWKMASVGPKTFIPQSEGGEGMSVTHSLLYTFSHALVQRIFGHSEFPLRVYGLAHYLISFVFLMLILNEIIKGERVFKMWGVAAGSALYLLNPLLIQHSVVVNTDNNILTTAILIFVYFFARFEKKKNLISARLVLALLLAVCFWAKEVTPAFLVFGMLMYRVLERDKRQFLLDFFWLSVLGVLLFWFTWWLYCFFTKTDVLGFVKFTLIGKSREAFSYKFIRHIPSTWLVRWRWPIYWVSAPFFISVFILIVSRARSFIRTGKVHIIDSILLMTFFMWTPYYFFKPNMDMMKYQYPSYPLLIVLIAWFFVELVRKSPTAISFIMNTKKAVFIFIFLVALTFYYYQVGDYMLFLWTPLYKHLNYHFFPYYYLPLVTTLLIICIALRGPRVYNNLILAVIFFVVPINAGLDLNQAMAKYNTGEVYLNYGESGFSDTVDYLAKLVKDGDNTVMRHDLYYYLTVRRGIKIEQNIVPETLLGGADQNKLDSILAQLPLKYVVFHKLLKFIPLPKESFYTLGKYYFFKKRIGDFYIYEKKNQ
jgi:hypothetical protein